MVIMTLLLNRSKFRQNIAVPLNYCRRYSSGPGATSKNTASTNYQSIADFYSGKSVFVTGGTGFCGKVLIEQLLHSCTGLDKIYLLIRDKEGATVNARLEEMFANPLFARIKEANPRSLDKVVPVKGDMVLPQLGINAEDKQQLVDKVSVVFHVAANIMFNAPLPVPMMINFEGTQKVLDLCKRIKNLEGFVCVSTAYAHTQRPILSEKIYPAPAKVEDVYKFMELHGNDKERNYKFIRGRSNPYCFVKALTESYVADNHGDVPTCLIRPSIVSAKVDEPAKGWLDNWFGATGVFHNIGKGWDRISLGDVNRVADFIPVDYVANLCIVAGANIKGSKSVQVYNSTTSAENPLKWADAYNYIIKESVNNGYNEAPYPFVVHSKSKLLVDILTILQFIPAHIADLWLRLKGQDPKYAKVVSQVIRLRKGYEYFNAQSWVMDIDRTAELFSKMSASDQKRFPFNPTNINWSEYMKDYCNGIQRYLKPKFTVRT